MYDKVGVLDFKENPYYGQNVEIDQDLTLDYYQAIKG